MVEIQERIQRAAESILEDEALSADLDDDAAKILLDWGIRLAQQIAGQTTEMDQAQAEEAMYLQMRALRKMLRNANKWTLDPDDSYLSIILEQACIVYGSSFNLPGDEVINAFTKQIPTDTSERLVALQRLVEGKTEIGDRR